MRRDPSKILSLDPLVQALASDDALPEGFASVWRSALNIARRRVMVDD